jgi:C-terminal processing protease CtpA/Prc
VSSTELALAAVCDAREKAVRRRNAALFVLLAVPVRTVVVNKAASGTPIGMEIVTDHAAEFFIATVSKCEPWQLELSVGDAIVAVDGRSTLTLSHRDLTQVLQRASGFVSLTVCRADHLSAAVSDARRGGSH